MYTCINEGAFAAHSLKRETRLTYTGNVRSQRLAERLGCRRLPPRPEWGERAWYVLYYSDRLDSFLQPVDPWARGMRLRRLYGAQRH